MSKWKHYEPKKKNRKKLSERIVLCRKKISDMTSDELINNKNLIDEEITSRGLGMLFG